MENKEVTQSTSSSQGVEADKTYNPQGFYQHSQTNDGESHIQDFIMKATSDSDYGLPENQGSSPNDETQNAESLSDSNPKEELKYKDAMLAYSNATLGISMVVAVLIGIGIGYGLESLFGVRWFFWLGVVWGVCAAILNVYKAYKRQKRELDELAKDPKYTYNIKNAKDDEDDD